MAMSLDGKIAKSDGDVQWLDEIPNPDQLDYGYYNFYATIDTTLMGNKTYQEVLGFGVAFPYPDKQNFVFTRNTVLTKDENVTYISGDIIQFTKNAPGKVIMNHLEAVNHCPTTRAGLKETLVEYYNLSMQ